MARLNGGAVTVTPGAAFGSVVGAPPQWSDESDATYAIIGADTALGASAFATAPIDTPTAEPLTATLHVRASTNANPVGGPQFSAGLEKIGGALGAESPFTAVTATPTDYALPLVAWGGFTPDDLAAGGFQLFAGWRNATTEPFVELYIFEMWLEVTYAGVAVAPPCRLYPRTDNLGNTPRNYPRPDTRQRSPRNTGTL